MADSTQVQLTFEVGGDAPDTAILRLSGGVVLQRQLSKGDEIHLQVVGMDGEVVADGYGRIVYVQFKDKLDEHGNVTATERIHGIKVT